RPARAPAGKPGAQTGPHRTQQGATGRTRGAAGATGLAGGRGQRGPPHARRPDGVRLCGGGRRAATRRVERAAGSRVVQRAPPTAARRGEPVVRPLHSRPVGTEYGPTLGEVPAW